MQINQLFKLGVILAWMLGITACASNSARVPEAASMEPEPAPAPSQAVPSAVGPDAGLTAEQLRARDEALAMTVFYFEFDRSDLSDEARAALVHHANRLKDSPGMRVRLEGHADERGTREYNLALGERRAQAIERYLQVQGVAASQMETISYGEESPAVTGTSEESYALNRRVEIR